MSASILLDEFEIEEEDEELLARALATARYLLTLSGLNEMQVRGLQNAIQAFERLPQPTEGINIAFGAVIKIAASSEVKDGLHYTLFYITEDALGITRGGMIDVGYGMDSFLAEGYVVSRRSPPERNYSSELAQELIEYYLKNGGRLEVDDQSSYTW